MGSPAGPDSALLVERELFAQEEILGRERTFRAQTENQKAEQIGKKVQPKQAEFHHGPMSFVFALLPSNWSQCSPFQVTPIIFCGGQAVSTTKRAEFDARLLINVVFANGAHGALFSDEIQLGFPFLRSDSIGAQAME